MKMAENLLRQVGNKIATIRKARNLTQGELAKRVGVTQPMIAYYEVGKKGISVDRLVALAKVLEVSCDDILGVPASKNKKRGPKSRIDVQFEEVQKLSQNDKKFISQFLDQMLKKAQEITAVTQ